MIYFEVKGIKSKKQYLKLLDWALDNSSSFSLVWRKNFKFEESAKTVQKKLKSYLERTEITDNWPGTKVFCIPEDKVIFYKTNEKSIEILKEVKSLFKWLAPRYPEDLAFYYNNKPIFGSVSHEEMAFFIGEAGSEQKVLEQFSGLKITSKIQQ